MPITFIKQDLTKVDEIFNCNGHVILHIGNCKGVMGAGVAKQIRSKWPQVYKDYKDKESTTGLNLNNIVMSNITKTLTVYTLLAQDTYGRYGSHINYGALKICLRKVALLEDLRFKEENTPLRKIYLPRFMGAGLAGGNWVEILQIIQETFSIHFDVFICTL
jgi:O-acetyl-ADP-ribose deacetylase (regulator of RNase III)